MTQDFELLDWSHVKTLLAVVETGSLSGAARALNLTQPTVGRHIQCVEAALGLNLFIRRAGGMEPTEQALSLIEPALAMKAAAHTIEMKAAGTAVSLSGTVRITASIFMSHHVMPQILARLRRETPEIALELVATDTTENLLFREADIAVRMLRPEQLDVVTQHIGDLSLGLFGSKSYLSRIGPVAGIEEFLNFDFVGYDRNEDIIQGFRAAGFSVDRDFFKVRCDHQTTYWELVKAGCGLGFGQRRQALIDPEIAQIDLGFPLPTLPVWLTAPSAIRHTPAVNKVWNVLREELSEVVDQ